MMAKSTALKLGYLVLIVGSPSIGCVSLCLNLLTCEAEIIILKPIYRVIVRTNEVWMAWQCPP